MGNRSFEIMKRLINVLAAVLVFALFAPPVAPLSAKGAWTSVRPNGFLLIGNASGQNPAEVRTDPYAFLQDALRKPGAGEKQVQGILTRVDCNGRSGITFVIKVRERTLRLRTDRFENVQITTFTSDVAGDITCGLRKPENLVVMCYLPLKGPRAKADGTAKSIEFVPKDFKLPPDSKSEKSP